MWEFVSDIIYFILLTGASLLALDYIFGTDKFKGIRESLCKEKHCIILYAGGVVLLSGTFHFLAHILESRTVMDLTTFYSSVAWFSTWCYYTIYFVTKGIVTFRSNNVLKRKKPQ